MMRTSILLPWTLALGPVVVVAQSAPATTVPYSVGAPVGTSPSTRASANVRVFGAIHNAESCAYDPERGVIVVLNRGASQRVLANDAFVSFINHDGSVHTSRWIGVQSPPARASLSPALTLNDPFGSEISKGVLYVSDSDGNTSTNDPRVAVIRKFDMRSGMPLGHIRIERSAWLNDIAVAPDGTIYATQTGGLALDSDPMAWQVLKVAPNGTVSLFAQGLPLKMPNGIALDPQGSVVVANSGDSAVLTFSPTGTLLRTEQAAQSGSDGLVIMADGTKYISSVFNGGVSRLRPGRAAELIASGIPSAASMCYDSRAKQLVIPMNDQNALAFLKVP